MKTYRFHFLMAAAFLAPHVSLEVAVVIGAAYSLLGFWSAYKDEVAA
jgi:hypothetical protein